MYKTYVQLLDCFLITSYILFTCRVHHRVLFNIFRNYLNETYLSTEKRSVCGGIWEAKESKIGGHTSGNKLWGLINWPAFNCMRRRVCSGRHCCILIGQSYKHSQGHSFCLWVPLYTAQTYRQRGPSATESHFPPGHSLALLSDSTNKYL